MDKRAYDIDLMFKRIGAAVKPFPKAAMFELAEEGFRTPFEQLVACIVSIRTRDEQMVKIARRAFDSARTPGEFAQMTPAQIDGLIYGSAFHEAKSRQVHAIAIRVVEEFGGELPCDFDMLTSLPGVGPKCANLVLGIACGQARIGVDIHVHRVTNRWGYVKAATPEMTMAALEAVLPQRYHVEINRLLVPFGKHQCVRVSPFCSTCPVAEFCQQVGVVKHR